MSAATTIYKKACSQKHTEKFIINKITLIQRIFYDKHEEKGIGSDDNEHNNHFQSFNIPLMMLFVLDDDGYKVCL